jgi:hypothetical protein
MPKPQADRLDVLAVEEFLAQYPDLKHLRVRKRGDLVILESGPKDAPISHARLRRETVQYWRLEMPSHSRWETTPFRGLRESVLAILIKQFGWTLEAIADYPAHISDRSY